MLKPIPMQRATLYLLHEDVPTVALILAQRGLFDPAVEVLGESQLSERPAQRYQELFRIAQMHLHKSLAHLSLEAALELGPESPLALSEQELEEPRGSARRRSASV